MQLSTRPAEYTDFEALYACSYTAFGYGDEHRTNVESEWRVFRDNPYALSVIVEDLNRNEEDRVIGYTEAVFVSEAFAERAKGGAEPYVNLQIARMYKLGKSPLLSLKQIGAANSGVGNYLHLAYTGWRAKALTSEEAYYVRAFMGNSLHKIGIGYNFQEVIIEVVGEVSRQRSLNAGFIHRTSYEAYFKSRGSPPEEQRPHLMSITRREAKLNDGSLLARVFAYDPPMFYFRPRDQELIELTLSGVTDEKVAATLECTVGNVKKRWEAMYNAVESVLPSLLPTTIETSRGPEKRRVLLAYLRDHPEELRPHSRPKYR